MQGQGAGGESEEVEPVRSVIREKVLFYMARLVVVFLIIFTSWILPNINVLLILGGSILGTIVSIVIPVLFYNRAYSDSPHNLEKDRGSREPETFSAREESDLIEMDESEPLVFSDRPATRT